MKQKKNIKRPFLIYKSAWHSLKNRERIKLKQDFTVTILDDPSEIGKHKDLQLLFNIYVPHIK